MSTPPGKPLNPIDHVSRKAREGAVTERPPSEGDNDPFARRTHQGEHASILVRNGILSRMTVIRLDRLTRRRKRVHPL
jgi:hypothetical protein